MPMSDDDKRLFRAVRKAVELGLLPESAPGDLYLANVKKIRALLAAADDEPPSPMHAMVAEYSNAVGRHGPDSDQARAVREKYAHEPGLISYADALDRIKRRLGGSGIDYPANRRPKEPRRCH